jgi:NADPH-dependent ferric siderophore reductase
VSGDTLTITGPDLSSYATTSYVDAQNQSQALTFVGDDSTGTAVNSGETFKIAGTQNVTTAVSGDTLTITGPDLSSYLTTVAFADLTSKPTTLSGYGITDAVASSSTAVTMVGDDSTGTGVNIGETFKIAGTQNVTTAVSGDTLTITGPDLSSYATQSYVTSQGYITNSTTTIVGDDSTGTTINSGETFKIAGTQNITTAVSGDTLTITGPDLSSYLTSETSHADVLVDGDFASAGFMKTDGAGTYSIDANTYLTSVAFGDLTSTPTTLSGYGITDAASSTATAVTVVGDDSTGTAVTLGETFKIAGTQNITTAVSGDTLTITGPDLSSYLTDNGLGDLTVTGSTISSPSNADLTLTTSGTGSVSIEAIQIKGTELSSTDSTQITVKEDLKVTGTTYTTSLFLTSEYGESQITSQSVTANELRTNEIKSRGSNADINIDPEGTGRVVAKGALEIQKGYIESINTLTSSSTITVDFSEASVHTVTLAENAQFVVTNLPTGATGTIIITQDGGGSNTGSFGTDGSTAVKFAGGTPTLSTAGNAIDVVTVFNDGTNYLGNIAKAYAA